MNESSRPTEGHVPHAGVSRARIGVAVAVAVAAVTLFHFMAPHGSAQAVDTAASAAAAAPSEPVFAAVPAPTGDTFHAGYALDRLPAEPDPSPLATGAYEPEGSAP